MLPGTIGLALGRSTSGTMEAADLPATHGGSLATLAGPLGLGCAVGSLLEGIFPFLVLLLLVPFHEVGLNFFVTPSPLPTTWVGAHATALS